MSVPTYERKESRLEYEQNCLKLLKTTYSKSIRFSKRETQLVVDPLVTAVRDLYAVVLHYKSLYCRKERAIIEERLSITVDVIGRCEYIHALLNIAYERNPKKFSDSQWSYWSALVDTEIKLFEGLKKKVSEELKRFNEDKQMISTLS